MTVWDKIMEHDRSSKYDDAPSPRTSKPRRTALDAVKITHVNKWPVSSQVFAQRLASELSFIRSTKSTT